MYLFILLLSVLQWHLNLDINNIIPKNVHLFLWIHAIILNIVLLFNHWLPKRLTLTKDDFGALCPYSCKTWGHGTSRVCPKGTSAASPHDYGLHWLQFYQSCLRRFIQQVGVWVSNLVSSWSPSPAWISECLVNLRDRYWQNTQRSKSRIHELCWSLCKLAQWLLAGLRNVHQRVRHCARRDTGRQRKSSG